MKLNILIISGALGGVERHTNDIINELSLRDYNIYHIAPKGYSTKRANTKFLDIPREISLRDIVVFISILKYFFSIKENIDIIHGHSSKGGLYARLLYFFSRAKIYYSPHAFYTMNPLLGKIKRIIIQFTEKILSLLTTKIILSSIHEETHAIKKLKIKKSKIIINPNCSYIDADRLINPNLISSQGLVFGFCGRLVNQKNPIEVLKIAKLLYTKKIKSKFLIMGDGYLKKNLMNYILKDNIENIEFIDHGDLDIFFNQINILLITSLYEGNPYLYQDALINSIPILTRNVGGSNYYVKNNKNGYIYNDINDLCDYILENLSTNEELALFSRASFDTSKKYSLNNMINSLDYIYTMK